MSEYSFGYDEQGLGPSAGEHGQDDEQGGNGLRQYLKEISGQLKELKAENDRLKDERRRDEVADALKAKGYAPQAAGLYTGDPNKLDEWLTANGGALAKLPQEGQEQPGEQVPQGPPASTVPADGQDQMQRMMEAGAQGAAPPQGSDKEISAALAAASSPEEFAQIMRAHGSSYDWS